MKKFITKIVVFILPICLLAYGIDRYISHNLKTSNVFAHSEYTVWNDILDGKLNAEIYIHGSSRAWVHFDPEILEDSLHMPAYNLGIDGHTFNMQQLRHELALKYNPKPKMVIHSVDATTLQKGNFYNAKQMLPYMLWNDDIQNYTSQYTSYSWFDYKLPLIRYYSETDAITEAIGLSLNSEKHALTRMKGYQGQERTWNQDFDKAKQLMKAYEITIDNNLKQRFDDYLKDCKTNDIEVVMVYAPVYIEGQEFILNEEDVKKIYKAFADRYGFQFFDFTDDNICFDKSYFYNARHMNKTGSELFTKKLASKIKSELLK